MKDTFLHLPKDIELQLAQEVRVLVLVDSTTTAEGLAMSDKILQACGLDPEVDAHRISVEHDINLASASLPDSVESLIIYGLSPKQLGANWQVTPYTWLRDNGRRWCFAERLELIAADPAKKRILWNCVKALKNSSKM